MKFLDFTCRLLAAMGLGALIGLERQLTGRAAGIRTCVLVCMGSAPFTAFPLTAADGDVTRAAMQIISGVGFLGSGVIFERLLRKLARLPTVGETGWEALE